MLSIRLLQVCTSKVLACTDAEEKRHITSCHQIHLKFLKSAGLLSGVSQLMITFETDLSLASIGYILNLPLLPNM
jgi:hypothetical protein